MKIRLSFFQATLICSACGSPAQVESSCQNSLVATMEEEGWRAAEVRCVEDGKLYPVMICRECGTKVAEMVTESTQGGGGRELLGNYKVN